MLVTATISSTYDQRPGGYRPPHFALNRHARLRFKVDSTVQAIAQNEVVAIGELPAGTRVFAACLKVDTADADITDVDVGYHATGDAGAQFLDGATLASTGYKETGIPGTDGILQPVLIAADSVVTLKNKDAHTINQAVFWVELDVSMPEE